MPATIYAASCAPDGGIYGLQLNEEGHLSVQSFMPADLVMYMAISGQTLDALLLHPFDGSDNSGLISCTLQPDGSLVKKEGVYSTGGIVACHLTINSEGTGIYCANYTSGSVARMDRNSLKLFAHKGHSVHPDRQTSPHVHQVVFTPDNRFVCAVDLGLDCIALYNPDLTFHGKVSLTKGCGPRHMVFSPDGRYAYCVNELDSTVTALSYDGQSLNALKSYSALPESFLEHERSQAAAIRITKDGRWLLTSNRGHNSLACFRVSDGQLDLHSVISCGGRWPRDFIFSPDEKFILCANEESDEITVLSFSDGMISDVIDRFPIKCPIALLSGNLTTGN